MGSCCITQGAQFVTLWQPRGMGGRLRREGTYIYLWLIHVVMWQRPIQYHKAIILQLNINFKISGRILRKAIAQIISSVCLWMLHIAPDLCSGGSLYLECTTFSACQIPQFSSVQSLSCVQLFATHESQHARPPSSTPGVHPDSRSSSQWCHPAISSSVDPSSPAPNPSQHQSLFQWVNSSHEVAKVLEFQL